MKSHLIKKYLKDNRIDFYLITNNDLHLNESPNLDLKDIYKLFKFDCTRGYILFFINRFIFFTDSRYTLAAKRFFKSNCEIYDLSEIPNLKFLFNMKFSVLIYIDICSIVRFWFWVAKVKENVQALTVNDHHYFSVF